LFVRGVGYSTVAQRYVPGSFAAATRRTSPLLRLVVGCSRASTCEHPKNQFQACLSVSKRAGRKALLVRGDIQDETRCRALVEKALDKFGRLVVLVNNAAYQASKERIEDLSSKQFERTYRTNVFAMCYRCKAALPRRRRQGVRDAPPPCRTY
jgi:NAD(P)-dependent dehydrogenase (short-subunit alcohol dehydrogenase family)